MLLHQLNKDINIFITQSMNKAIKTIVAILFCSMILASCGTIFGGSKYYAHVIVNNNNDAKIYYRDEYVGTGTASFKVKRYDANKVNITLKDRGCKDQTFSYKSNTIRGWATAGTILFWTGTAGGIPIPWGLGLDLITGALIKPNVMEEGISKDDYKNFKYTLEYKGCGEGNSNSWDSEKPNAPRKDAKSAWDVEAPKQELKQETKLNYTDEIQLKNGSVIKGFILEQLPSVQLKLQTGDGNLFVFKIEEVQKITPNMNTLCTDIIYLKNGSILKGRIIEETIGVQVKFQTKDGNVFIYEAERVDKIERESK